MPANPSSQTERDMNESTNPKYIFVTGGVVSSLGKGIASSALGALLESRGLKVSITKMDPYLNVDPGTMNPSQHGEVFVTDDGAETDMDLGHYERFITRKMTRLNSFSAGQVYKSVIEQERHKGFGGVTVQVIPHITNEIQRRIIESGENVDIAIIEVGGTVGDIESLPFLEAIRQMGLSFSCIFVHLTLIPLLKSSDEMKTKPTQHSVKELRSIGVQPDVLLCRCEKPFDKDARNKISLFTNVEQDAVICIQNVDSIYEVPELLASQHLDDIVLGKLGLSNSPKVGAVDVTDWHRVIDKLNAAQEEVSIAMVGKYTNLTETYKSLHEALKHAGIHSQTKVHIEYIDSDELRDDALNVLQNYDGILVPGGFGERGTEGKIEAIRYARENNVPYLGICLGMQLAVVEYARHVADMPKANSVEFDAQSPYPVVVFLEDWVNDSGQQEVRTRFSKLGGSMRLGGFAIKLEAGTIIHELYGTSDIRERHRHRYEISETYVSALEEAGLKVSGRSQDLGTVESIELPNHPWFVAVQFHPEFTSTPRKGHQLFTGYIEAVLRHRQQQEKVPLSPEVDIC